MKTITTLLIAFVVLRFSRQALTNQSEVVKILNSLLQSSNWPLDDDYELIEYTKTNYVLKSTLIISDHEKNYVTESNVKSKLLQTSLMINCEYAKQYRWLLNYFTSLKKICWDEINEKTRKSCSDQCLNILNLSLKKSEHLSNQLISALKFLDDLIPETTNNEIRICLERFIKVSPPEDQNSENRCIHMDNKITHLLDTIKEYIIDNDCDKNYYEFDNDKLIKDFKSDKNKERSYTLFLMKCIEEGCEEISNNYYSKLGFKFNEKTNQSKYNYNSKPKHMCMPKNEKTQINQLSSLIQRNTNNNNEIQIEIKKSNITNESLKINTNEVQNLFQNIDIEKNILPHSSKQKEEQKTINNEPQNEIRKSSVEKNTYQPSLMQKIDTQ